jgi:hypothetical protein
MSNHSEVNWIDLLQARGINQDAIDFCEIDLHETGTHLRFPFEYENGELRVSLKALPGKTPKMLHPPKDDLPNGVMPPFYTPRWQETQSAIRQANGIVFFVEGHPDFATMVSAGYYNVLASAGAKIEETAIHAMHRMGVKVIYHIPDVDSAGWESAHKFYDLVEQIGKQYGMLYFPCKLPVLTAGAKDLNDYFRDLQFNRDEFVKFCEYPPKIELIVGEQRAKIEGQSSDFVTAVSKEIELRLEDIYGTIKYNAKGYSQPIACLFANHQHDHKAPAGSWNSKGGYFSCLKCGRAYNTKETAQQLNIDWQPIARKIERAPRVEEVSPDYSKYNESLTRPPMAKNRTEQPVSEQNVANAGQNVGVSKLMRRLQPDHTVDLPLEDFFYTDEEAAQLHISKIRGEHKYTSSPKLPFPFAEYSPELRKLGGNAVALERGSVSVILGQSGGYKTSFLISMINIWRRLGYHGIVISPEWGNQKHKRDSLFTRSIQQMGGMSMTQSGLLYQHHYEQNNGVAPNLRFGLSANDDLIEMNEKIALEILAYPGKVGYISYFGADIVDYVNMVKSAYAAMSQQGHQPAYIIWDYLQMMRNPYASSIKWDPSQTVDLIKHVGINLDLATLVSSQVTKSDGREAKNGDFDKGIGGTEEIKLLDSFSGVWLRDDQSNFFLTLNLTDLYDSSRKLRKMIVYITKNSEGGSANNNKLKAQIPFWVDLERGLCYPQSSTSRMYAKTIEEHPHGQNLKAGALFPFDIEAALDGRDLAQDSTQSSSTVSATRFQDWRQHANHVDEDELNGFDF